MVVDCSTNITFEGEESITVYDSSEWAERGFCNKCDSRLFYRLKGSNQHMVPVGLFDDQAPFVFDSQVFIDKKPSFYSFANQTTDMAAAEIFEMYAPS
ncbi:GFA family protein [Vacuolonema iberomarrocanum]|uniref:GFA family protein n=1 Tax=Vacuolonema iberomarrocanum TaxID=3454632 RepID=UPI003F6E03C9